MINTDQNLHHYKINYYDVIYVYWPKKIIYLKLNNKMNIKQ